VAENGLYEKATEKNKEEEERKHHCADNITARIVTTNPVITPKLTAIAALQTALDWVRRNCCSSDDCCTGTAGF
jgi:hypothetical protein